MKQSMLTLTLVLTSNPIRCDHTARWMKLAEIENLVSLILKCEYPQTLNGANWSEVQVKDFVEPKGKVN